jgi:hypothetical protein
MHASKTTVRRLARPSATAGTALALALSCGVASALTPLPSTPRTYYSINTPYDDFAFGNSFASAQLQFTTEAQLDYGLQLAGSNFNDQAVGSFQGSAAGRTLNLGNGITANLTSSASLWARIQAGPDPIAFYAMPANRKFLHVASGADGNPVSAQDATLFTLTFSRPVQGFSFIGAGISDYAGASGIWPAQQVRLDGGAPINVVNVNPTSIYNPMQMSFAVLSPTTFSSVSLFLPAGSYNDNAALANFTVAFDPLSPVPEPTGLILAAASLAVLAVVGRIRH